MKILFICSSLNPGVDGVGDYTRRLSTTLRDRGHEIYLASVNEKPWNLESPDDDQRVLRLTAASSWKKREDRLGRFLQICRPERISLQYVPYGFQKKGLPFVLPYRLASLASGNVWHIMFHEIWVGITCSSPWRHKLTGFFQRGIARNLIKLLKPAVVHTSNPLYVELLKNAGIPVRRLPLFGSIDWNSSQLEWMADRLAEVGITSANRKEWMVAGMFGSCYPDFPLENQVCAAAAKALARGKKFASIGVGGGVGTGVEWEARVRKAVPFAVAKHFGRQSEARISAFLQNLDLGIPSTPVEFVGKSSACASMALHGAELDNSYRVDMPEYRHMCLADWPQEDLFWRLEKVADEMEAALETSARPGYSK